MRTCCCCCRCRCCCCCCSLCFSHRCMLKLFHALSEVTAIGTETTMAASTVMTEAPGLSEITNKASAKTCCNHIASCYRVLKKQYKCCYFTCGGYCCVHSRLVARVKVPLLLSAVINPCCDLLLAHCSFFSLRRPVVTSTIAVLLVLNCDAV